MTHAHDRTLIAKLGFGDPDAGNSLHDLACLYIGAPERAEALVRLVYNVPVTYKAGRFSRDVEEVVKRAPTEAEKFERKSQIKSQEYTSSATSTLAAKLAARKAAVAPKFATKLAAQRVWTLEEIEEEVEETKERTIRSLPCELANVTTKPHYECPISKGQNQYKTTIGFIDVVIESAVCGPVMFEDQHVEERSEEFVRIGVEVKIARESIGNCLRQIELYRSHSSPDFWVHCWVLVSPWGISEEEVGMLASSSIRHVKLGPGFEEFCQRPQQAASSATL